MRIVALDAEPVGGSSTRRIGVPPVRPGNPTDTTGPPNWHEELKRAVRDPHQLVTALELPPSLIEPARHAARSFPLFAPWPYIHRMAKGDSTDPLLRQVLPLAGEQDNPPGFSAD